MNASSAVASASGLSQPSVGRSPRRSPIGAATSASSRAGSRTRARGGELDDAVRGPADEEHVGCGRLREVPGDREEQRIVRAGATSLEPRVDVVGAAGRLQRHDRVLRIAAHGDATSASPRERWSGGRRRDRPRLDHDRRREVLVARRQEPARPPGAARDGDPDRRVAIGAVEPLGRQQVADPGASSSSTPSVARSRGRRPSAGGAPRAPPARSGAHHARAASRRCRRPAGTRGRTRTGAAHLPGGARRRPRRVRAAGACRAHASTSTAPIDDSGPRALAMVSSHSSSGSLRQVIPPPTCSVSRSPSTTNVRMRMLEPSARPARATHRPAVGTTTNRLQPLDELHRPDLRRAGDAPARKRGGEEVEGAGIRAELAGHGRDEVLDGGGALEAAGAGHADRPRVADPPEVVAQHVDDHHVLGPVLGAGQQLPGERAVLLAGPAARPRALDRIGRHEALGVDREERLGRGREERPRATTGRRGPDVEEAGEQGRVAGPQTAEDGPRIAVEWGLEAARQVGLVDIAAGDRLAHGLDVDPAVASTSEPNDVGAVRESDGRSAPPRTNASRRSRTAATLAWSRP